jgi:hypothetical protein
MYIYCYVFLVLNDYKGILLDALFSNYSLNTCVGSNVNNSWTLPLTLGNSSNLDSVQRHVKSSTFSELPLQIVM